MSDRQQSDPIMPSQMSSEDVDKSIDKSPMPDRVFDDPPDTPMPQSVTHESGASPMVGSSSEAKSAEESSSYGPVRRKVLNRQAALALYRPGRMAQDDFSEMMQEVVRHLLEKVLQGDASSSAEPSQSDARSSAIKRSSTEWGQETSDAVESQRTQSPDRVQTADDVLAISHEGSTFACDEVAILSV